MDHNKFLLQQLRIRRDISDECLPVPPPAPPSHHHPRHLDGTGRVRCYFYLKIQIVKNLLKDAFFNISLDTINMLRITNCSSNSTRNLE